MTHAIDNPALGGSNVPLVGNEGLGRQRDVARMRLLQTLLHQRASSRAELGRVLGLSRATVTALVTELEQAGIIEQQSDEGGHGRRATGRPPLQVSLAPDAAFAVGLDVGQRQIRAVACNLGGEILASRVGDADVEAEPGVALDVAERLTRAVVAAASVDRGRVLGVGVGLAAPIDRLKGPVHAGGPLPGWSGTQAARELETRLQLPVQIENDANAGAMGESLFGAGRGVNEMAYLRLSAGVGLGIITGGRLLRGFSGVAGELGHTMAVENGLICRCGGRGCLETVVNPVAVAGLVARSREEPVSLQRLIELVGLGDRGARRAVADAGTLIGHALATVVNLLNPELVIVGGDLAEAGDVLLTPIREAVEQRALASASAAVRVVGSELGDHAEALGAAAIQLARAPHELTNRIFGSAAAA